MRGKLEIYIRDNTGTWVDFTDRFSKDSNGLEQMSNLVKSLADDISGSVFRTSLTKITLDNSDFFWDSLENWDGDYSDFTSSKNGYETDLSGHWIKIVEFFNDKSESNYQNLGFYRIKSFSTYLNKGIAEITLKSISQYLNEKKAEFAKFGKGWYINRPVSFLLNKLLSNLDSDIFSINLPDRIRTPTVDNIRVFSTLGTPPEEVRNNIYNPLTYYPYSSDDFSDEFLHDGLQGRLG